MWKNQIIIFASAIFLKLQLDIYFKKFFKKLFHLLKYPNNKITTVSMYIQDEALEKIYLVVRCLSNMMCPNEFFKDVIDIKGLNLIPKLSHWIR